MGRFCLICIRAPLDPETDVRACPPCIHRLRARLLAISEELPHLRDCLQLGAAPANGRGGGRANAPLPLRIAALDLLGPGLAQQFEDVLGDQIGGIPLPVLLTGWADFIAREFQYVARSHGTLYNGPCYGARPRHGTDLSGWCRWLTAYVPHAVTRPWVADLYEQLDDALTRIRAVTHTEPQRHVRSAPCPVCERFALVRTDGDWEIKCEGCGHTMEPAAYDQHAAAVLPPLGHIAALMVDARRVAALRVLAAEPPALEGALTP